jgi:hypothetical protein
MAIAQQEFFGPDGVVIGYAYRLDTRMRAGMV